MIALIAVAAWIFVLTLVAGLCVAARRGDRAQLQGGAQLPAGEPAGLAQPAYRAQRAHRAPSADRALPAHAPAAASLRHAA